MHSVCSCVSSVTEFCSFVQTKNRRKRRKKNKNLSTTPLDSLTVVQKTILNSNWNQPSLFCFITFHLCCSRRRDREVFCLKFQKQLYHHARLRERERDFSHTSLSLLCVVIYFKNVKSSVFWVKDSILFSKTDRVFVFIINARKLRRRRRRQRCRC